jgi:hypothetical protein
MAIRQFEVPVNRWGPAPLHRLHAPVLPQETVAAARAEIGDLQPLDAAQPFDLFPQPGHGAGVQHLQLELAHVLQHGARAQFHQHGQRGDFPQHHLGPLALEGQLVLAVALFQMIGGQRSPRTTP